MVLKKITMIVKKNINNAKEAYVVKKFSSILLIYLLYLVLEIMFSCY